MGRVWEFLILAPRCLIFLMGGGWKLFPLNGLNWNEGDISQTCRVIPTQHPCLAFHDTMNILWHYEHVHIQFYKDAY